MNCDSGRRVFFQGASPHRTRDADLIDVHRLSENEACEHIRSRATRLRATVGEVATMVIDAHEAMEKLGLDKRPG